MGAGKITNLANTNALKLNDGTSAIVAVDVVNNESAGKKAAIQVQSNATLTTAEGVTIHGTDGLNASAGVSTDEERFTFSKLILYGNIYGGSGNGLSAGSGVISMFTNTVDIYGHVEGGSSTTNAGHGISLGSWNTVTIHRDATVMGGDLLSSNSLSKVGHGLFAVEKNTILIDGLVEGGQSANSTGSLGVSIGAANTLAVNGTVRGGDSSGKPGEGVAVSGNNNTILITGLVEGGSSTSSNGFAASGVSLDSAGNAITVSGTIKAGTGKAQTRVFSYGDAGLYTITSNSSGIVANYNNTVTLLAGAEISGSTRDGITYESPAVSFANGGNILEIQANLADITLNGGVVAYAGSNTFALGGTATEGLTFNLADLTNSATIKNGRFVTLEKRGTGTWTVNGVVPTAIQAINITGGRLVANGNLASSNTTVTVSRTYGTDATFGVLAYGPGATMALTGTYAIKDGGTLSIDKTATVTGTWSKLSFAKGATLETNVTNLAAGGSSWWSSMLGRVGSGITKLRTTDYITGGSAANFSSWELAGGGTISSVSQLAKANTIDDGQTLVWQNATLQDLLTNNKTISALGTLQMAGNVNLDANNWSKVTGNVALADNATVITAKMTEAQLTSILNEVSNREHATLKTTGNVVAGDVPADFGTWDIAGGATIADASQLAHANLVEAGKTLVWQNANLQDLNDSDKSISTVGTGQVSLTGNVNLDSGDWSDVSGNVAFANNATLVTEKTTATELASILGSVTNEANANLKTTAHMTGGEATSQFAHWEIAGGATIANASQLAATNTVDENQTLVWNNAILKDLTTNRKSITATGLLSLAGNVNLDDGDWTKATGSVELANNAVLTTAKTTEADLTTMLGAVTNRDHATLKTTGNVTAGDVPADFGTWKIAGGATITGASNLAQANTVDAGQTLIWQNANLQDLNDSGKSIATSGTGQVSLDGNVNLESGDWSNVSGNVAFANDATLTTAKTTATELATMLGEVTNRDHAKLKTTAHMTGGEVTSQFAHWEMAGGATIENASQLATTNTVDANQTLIWNNAILKDLTRNGKSITATGLLSLAGQVNLDDGDWTQATGSVAFANGATLVTAKTTAAELTNLLGSVTNVDHANLKTTGNVTAGTMPSQFAHWEIAGGATISSVEQLATSTTVDAGQTLIWQNAILGDLAGSGKTLTVLGTLSLAGEVQLDTIDWSKITGNVRFDDGVTLVTGKTTAAELAEILGNIDNQASATLKTTGEVAAGIMPSHFNQWIIAGNATIDDANELARDTSIESGQTLVWHNANLADLASNNKAITATGTLSLAGNVSLDDGDWTKVAGNVAFASGATLVTGKTTAAELTALLTHVSGEETTILKTTADVVAGDVPSQFAQWDIAGGATIETASQLATSNAVEAGQTLVWQNARLSDLNAARKTITATGLLSLAGNVDVDSGDWSDVSGNVAFADNATLTTAKTTAADLTTLLGTVGNKANTHLKTTENVTLGDVPAQFATWEIAGGATITGAANLAHVTTVDTEQTLVWQNANLQDLNDSGKSIETSSTGQVSLDGNVNLDSGDWSQVSGNVAFANNATLTTAKTTESDLNTILASVTNRDHAHLKTTAAVAAGDAPSQFAQWEVAGHGTSTSVAFAQESTTIDAGATLATSAAVLTSAQQVVNDGTLTADAITVNGQISGTGSVTKTGAGEMVIAASQTYTGATSVEAGKVTLNRGVSLASDVTVGDGATLYAKSGAATTDADATATADSSAESTAESAAESATASTTAEVSTEATSSLTPRLRLARSLMARASGTTYTQTVQSLTFANGSTFQVDVDADKYTKVKAVGDITIGENTTLKLNLGSITTASSLDNVLTAGGTLSGAFTHVAYTSRLFTFTPTYDYTAGTMSLTVAAVQTTPPDNSLPVEPGESNPLPIEPGGSLPTGPEAGGPSLPETGTEPGTLPGTQPGTGSGTPPSTSGGHPHLPITGSPSTPETPSPLPPETITPSDPPYSTGTIPTTPAETLPVQPEQPVPPTNNPPAQPEQPVQPTQPSTEPTAPEVPTVDPTPTPTPTPAHSLIVPDTVAEGYFGVVPIAETLDNVLVNAPRSDLAAKFYALETQQAVARAVSETQPLFAGALPRALMDVTDLVKASVPESHPVDSELAHQAWVNIIGGNSRLGAKDGTTGYQGTHTGIVVGNTLAFSSSTLGAFLSATHSSLKSHGGVANQDAKTEQVFGGVYGTLGLTDRVTIDTIVGFGDATTKGKRHIDFAKATAESRQKSQVATAGVGVNWKLGGPTLSVTPFARVDYTRVTTRGYDESGAGALNLAVNRQSTDSIVVRTGVKVDAQMSSAWKVSAKASVGHELADNATPVTASFAGMPNNVTNTAFTVENARASRTFGSLGAAAIWKLTPTTELGVQVETTVRSGANNTSATVTLRHRF